MKKNILISLLFCLFLTPTLFGKFLFDTTNYQLPTTNKFRLFLNVFFRDPDVCKYFIEREKYPMLDHVQDREIRSDKKRLQTHKRKMRRVQKKFRYYENLKAKIFKKYEITDLGENNHILRFKKHPFYLLKLLKYEWPLKFQNISRVFHNDNIKDFIKDKCLSHFKTVNKFLYILPTARKRKDNKLPSHYLPLEDYYFGVITQLVPNLPQSNAEQLLSLVDVEEINKEQYVVPSSKVNDERVTQLLLFVTGNGIWNTKDIFINQDGFFVDVDTEESGLDAWREPLGWKRFDHCLKRYFDENLLTKEGIEEMKRKIINEGDCGMDGLHEIFKKKIKRKTKPLIISFPKYTQKK